MSAKKTIPERLHREIEVRAYLIWESEGKPEGKQEEHWKRAEAEVFGAKPKMPAAPPTEPAELPAAKPKKAKPAAKPQPNGKAHEANTVVVAAKAKKSGKAKSGKHASH